MKLKDALYYDDLIAEIKDLAGIEKITDEIQNKRLFDRCQKVEKIVNGKVVSSLPSPFVMDLITIATDIIKKGSGTDVFKYLEEISNYPELIKEVLKNLEVTKIENYLLCHLEHIMIIMGTKDDLSLEPGVEQRVCLFKRNNLWYVHIQERGIICDEKEFDNCFDACIDVIDRCAETKEQYEKHKKELTLLKQHKPINQQKH